MLNLKPVVLITTILLMVTGLISCNPVFNAAIKRQNLADKKIDRGNPVSVMIQKDAQFGEEWLSRTGVETIVLHTPDGIALQGYYVPSQIASKKLAILIHGHRADARMMAKYGVFYHEMEYQVFMADCRAHGKSGGDYGGMGWLDRLDYLQWVDLLIKKTGPDVQILIHGISMGGATVMMMSGEPLPPQVKVLIEDSGYTSVYDELKYQINQLYHLPAFPLLNIANNKTIKKAGYSFEEASALNQVKKSQTPILFIHSGADNYNPTEMVHRLYDAAICPKELLIVRGSLHAMAYHDAPELYENTIKAFTEKYIAP